MSLPFPEDIVCRDVVELISDFVDRALTRAVCEGLEMHLALCDGCRSYVDQVRASIAVSGRLAEEPLPEALEARLLEVFRGGGEA